MLWRCSLHGYSQVRGPNPSSGPLALCLAVLIIMVSSQEVNAFRLILSEYLGFFPSFSWSMPQNSFVLQGQGSFFYLYRSDKFSLSRCVIFFTVVSWCFCVSAYLERLEVFLLKSMTDFYYRNLCFFYCRIMVPLCICISWRTGSFFVEEYDRLLLSHSVIFLLSYYGASVYLLSVIGLCSVSLMSNKPPL